MEKDGEQTDEGNDTGKKPDTDVADDKKNISELDKSKKLTAKEMKAENDALEIELQRTENINKRMALGGQSEAGQSPPKKTELTDKEIAEKFGKGEMDIL